MDILLGGDGEKEADSPDHDIPRKDMSEWAPRQFVCPITQARQALDRVSVWYCYASIIVFVFSDIVVKGLIFFIGLSVN